jgi:hypothetical protein
MFLKNILKKSHENSRKFGLLSSGTPFKEFLDPPLANTSSYQKMLNDLPEVP